MEMLIKYLLLLHVAAGFTSLCLFFVPAIARKGGKVHNTVGRWYTYGMWVVIVTAIVLCIIRYFQGQYVMALFLGFLALLTSQPLYLGIAVLRNKKGPSERMWRINLALAALLAIFSPFLLGTGLGFWGPGGHQLLIIFGILGIAITWPGMTSKLLGKASKEYNWLEEHVSGLVISAIAAFTAFFAFGGRRFLGDAFGGNWEIIAWVAPTVLGVAFIRYYKWKLRRKKVLVTIKAVTLLLIGTLATGSLSAQLYLEKQTRHRFAEMTIGADVAFGGQGMAAFAKGDLIEEPGFTTPAVPRLLIGGTHFWGHADFQIAFPLRGTLVTDGERTINAYAGVETMFKAYPWRIEHHKIRPFVGLGLLPFFYEQSTGDDPLLQGPGREKLGLMLKTGINFRHNNHLFELGFNFNPTNDISYPISRDRFADVSVAQSLLTMTYRYAFDTTIGSEEDWESGRTAKVTEKLAANGKLSGLVLIVGPSSAAWRGPSAFNEQSQAWLAAPPSSFFVEFGLGYYLHKPDVNVALIHRNFNTTSVGYGVEQELNRRSVGLEVTKVLGDYHGFAPFIGPIVSREWLGFSNSGTEARQIDAEGQKWAAGITFGWDIRPNRLQYFTLRTNVRYYPKLQLDLGQGDSASFSAWEFNFIQLVVYPGRIF